MRLVRAGVVALGVLPLLAGAFCPSTPKPQDNGPVGQEGMTLVSADGRLTVIIPAGALTQQINVTVDMAGELPGAVGQVYELGPSGTQFALPVTLLLSYANDPVGDPERLRLATLTAGSTWTALDNAQLDDAAAMVTGETSHFSTFGLVSLAGAAQCGSACPAGQQVVSTACSTACGNCPGAANQVVCRPEPPVGCGDGMCDAATETCANCPEDCTGCGGCGDGTCMEFEEDCNSCQEDCGACPVCGNGLCTAPSETCASCTQDCGTCTDTDGDGLQDHQDNCPFHANPGQEDADFDGAGEICEPHVRGAWPQYRTPSQYPRYQGRFGSHYNLEYRPVEDASALADTLLCTGHAGPFVAMCTYEPPDGEACGLHLISGALQAMTSGDTGEGYLAFDQVILVVETAGATVRGRDIAVPASAALAQLATLETATAVALPDNRTEEGFITEDMVHVRDPADAPLLIVAGNATWKLAGDPRTQYVPLVLGINPLSGALRFTIRVDPTQGPRSTQQVTNIRPVQMAVTDDARILVRTGKPAFGGALQEIRFPDDGRVTVTRAVDLSRRPVEFQVQWFGTDDRGRLYTVGHDQDEPTSSCNFFESQKRYLRVFSRTYTLLFQRRVEEDLQVQQLFAVDREERTGEVRYLARLIGSPYGQGCYELQENAHKDPTQFTDDPDDPVACPEMFHAACDAYVLLDPSDPARDDHPCPCRLCEGFPSCGTSFRVGTNTLMVEYAFEETPAGGVTLATNGRRPAVLPYLDGLNVDDARRLAFDGKGTAVSATALFDLDHENPGTPVWEFKDPRLTGGRSGSTKPRLRDIIFDSAPEGTASRFVAMLTDDVLVNSPARSVVVGESGTARNLISASAPAVGPNLDVGRGLLLPLEGNRILHVGGDGIGGTVVRIFIASGQRAHGVEVRNPAAGEAPVVLKAAPDGRLAIHRLGIEPDTPGVRTPWVSCVLAPDVECDLEQLVEDSRVQPVMQVVLAQSGRSDSPSAPEVKRQCHEIEQRTIASQNGQTAIIARCKQWEEVLIPGVPGPHGYDMVDVLRTRHWATWTAEDDVDPSPSNDPNIVYECRQGPDAASSRVFIEPGSPLEVRLFDEQGQPVQTISSGDTVYARATQASGSVMYGVGAGATATVVPQSDGSAAITATGEGVLVVEVTEDRGGGYPPRTGRVVILVEGPQSCADALDGESFHSCAVAAPYLLPAPNKLESPTTPAMVGSVLLHDRSLKLDIADHTLPAAGMPLTVGRTYRSGVELTEGGVMGGWSFWMDERLVLVNDTEVGSGMAPERCQPEPLPAGAEPNVALYDGTGRVDVWAHAAGAQTMAFGPSGETFWLYDHTAETLEAASFTARVVTYQRPPGRFERLRSYTLVLAPGEPPSQVHPYYVPGSYSVSEHDTRFYELMSPNGMRHIYNCRGQLIRIIDPQFHEIELVYDGAVHPVTLSHMLSQIIDANGRITSVDWWPVGDVPQIYRIKDPYGRELLYGYDSTPKGPRLTTVLLDFNVPDARSVTQQWRYTYDADGRLVTAIRPDGKTALTVTYAADGSVSQQTMGQAGVQAADVVQAGATWSFAGSADTVDVVDPRGVTRHYTLTALASGPKVVTREEHRRLVFPDGADPMTGQPAETDIITATTHNADGQVIQRVHPGGRTMAWQYDADGYMLQTSEIPNPQLPMAQRGRTKTWRWTYFTGEDDCHLIETATSPQNDVTRYTLAAFAVGSPGLRCRHASRQLPTTTEGTSTDAYLWEAAGELRGFSLGMATTTSGLGEVRRHALDYQRDPAPTRPADTASGKRTADRRGFALRDSFTGPTPADCQGNVPAEILRRLETDDRGNVTRETLVRSSMQGGDIVVSRTFDAKDRLIRQVDDPTGFGVVTNITHNLVDEITRVAKDARDHLNGLAAVGGHQGMFVREQFHDVLGRQYGAIEYTTDAPEVWATVEGFDADGNRIRTLQPGPGADAATIQALADMVRSGAWAAQVFAQYDEARVASTFTDQNGPALVLGKEDVDADGRLVARTITDGRTTGAQDVFLHSITTRRMLDLEGNVVVEDPGRTDRAVRVHNVYNGNNLVLQTSIRDPGCAPGGYLVRTEMPSYDGYDNPLEVFTTGSPGSVADPHAAMPTGVCAPPVMLAHEVRTYDARGRLGATTRMATPLTADPVGELTDTHAALTQVTTWRYDDESRPVERDRQGDLETMAYTFFGAECAVRHGVRDTGGDDLTMARFTSFDSAGLSVATTQQHFASGEAPDNGVTIMETLKRDALGRVSQRTNGVGMVWKMAYDGLNRERAVKDTRGYSPYVDGAYGVTVSRRYDGIGNVTEERRLAHHPDRPDETRTRTVNYRGHTLVGEQFRDAGGVRDAQEFVVDVLGNVVRSFPYGRMAGLAEERRYNELGMVLEEQMLSGASQIHEYDASGNRLHTTAQFTGDPPVGYDGHGAAPDPVINRFYRYNGLGHRVFARENGAVLQRWNSFGNLLEEEHVDLGQATGDPARMVRATYDDRGNLTALMYPDAFPDSPDLLYEHDARGRLTAIRAPASGSRTFPNLDSIVYRHRGDYVAERDVTVVPPSLGTLKTFTARFDYNELGDRYIVEHFQGDPSVASNKLGESRNYWFGEDVAAQATVPFAGGVAQGGASTTLQNMRTFINGGRSKSHLSDWAPALAGITGVWPVFPGNVWPATYQMYTERNSFGDELSSETVVHQPFSGRPAISFKWRTLRNGSWRVDNEQFVSWLGDIDGEVFANGRFTQWRNVSYAYEDAVGGTVVSPDRLRRVTQRLFPMPPTVNLVGYPTTPDYSETPDPIPSEHSYDLDYTASRQLSAFGFSSSDPRGAVAPNAYTYDALDRMVQVRDNQTGAYSETALGFSIDRAIQHRLGWDALDRRRAETYLMNTTAGVSTLSTEKPRTFTHFDQWTVQETSTTPVAGTVTVDSFLYGAGGEQPYVAPFYGEYVAFDDVNGTFAGFYDVNGDELAAVTSATSGDVAFKGQPYLKGATALEADYNSGLLELLVSGFLVGVNPPDATTPFRRLGNNGAEVQPFEQMFYSPLGGHVMTFGDHPHEHQEEQVLSQVGQGVALMIAIPVAIMAVAVALPAALAVALIVTATAVTAFTQARDLIQEYDYNGFTTNAKIMAAELALTLVGLAGSMSGPKLLPEAPLLRLKGRPGSTSALASKMTMRWKRPSSLTRFRSVPAVGSGTETSPRFSRLALHNQGPRPTCAPTCVAMHMEDLRPNLVVSRIPSRYPGVYSKTPSGFLAQRGLTIDEIEDVLAANGFTSRIIGGRAHDLEKALKQGKKIIATVTRQGGGHAIIVDKVFYRGGVRMVAIRDPWGVQYNQTSRAFDKLAQTEAIAFDP